MSTTAPVKDLPPEGPRPSGRETQSSIRLHFSWRKFALAFAVAALSDGLSFFLTPVPPLQWAANGVTALLLFMVLSWQWILLPGLIMEAIPGLNVFPFWVLAVGAVAMWGTARPNLKSMVPPGKGSAGCGRETSYEAQSSVECEPGVAHDQRVRACHGHR